MRRSIKYQFAPIGIYLNATCYQAPVWDKPNADVLLSSLFSRFIKLEETLHILNCLLKYSMDLGRYRIAETYGRKALELSRKNYRSGHPSIGISQSNLALVLKDLGELTEARDLAKQAYEVFLHQLGPEHPKTKTVKKTGNPLGKRSNARRYKNL